MAYRTPIEELGAEAPRRGGRVAADSCGATRRDCPAQRRTWPAEYQTQWHGQGDRAEAAHRRLGASRGRRAARLRSFRSTRSGPAQSQPRRRARASRATQASLRHRLAAPTFAPLTKAPYKDKPFGWPRKARPSLTATRHDGAAVLRSGRKNGSAGSNKRMGAKAGFVPRFCHHDTRGPPSIFLAQKTGTIADFPIRHRGDA